MEPCSFNGNGEPTLNTWYVPGSNLSVILRPVSDLHYFHIYIRSSNSASLRSCVMFVFPMCIYLNLAIDTKEFYILELYPWSHSAPKTIFGLVETRVHAALEMPATLAALGVIFQALPALYPCEFSRAERCKPCPVVLVPTLSLLPASTSQPPPAGIRSVRE